ncbi:NRDE-2, necessary for RNA interference-domain-containing protein [Lipomyces japonicus]|uniref:NRDE-2, necessary for RNA interference-domain-containing protein n=1 Tax=Lipomyces japonicus TaxID=56871 RepID=UPI0034CE4E05
MPADDNEELQEFTVPKFSSFKAPAQSRSTVRKKQTETFKTHGPNSEDFRHSFSRDVNDRTAHDKGYIKSDNRLGPPGHRSRQRPTRIGAPPETGQHKLPIHQKEANGIFEIDVKRDLNNLAFESLNKSDLPSFYRFGHGGVVGLNFKYFENESNSYSRQPANLNTKSQSSWVIGRHPKRIKVAAIIPDYGDYIPLSNTTKPSFSEKVIKFEDSDLDSEMEDTPVYQSSKVISLSKAADNQPYDENIWIDLAKAMESSAANKISIKLLTELSLSVYEKALKYIPNSTVLNLKYMGLYQSLNGHYQTSKKWQALLDAYPDNLQFWSNWIEFCINDATGFDFDKVYGSIIDVIGRVTSAARKTISLEVNVVYLCIRAAKFIYESGYTEHGISIIQGLLEVNFCAPENVDKISWLKEHWELDGPRIGDKVDINGAWVSEYGAFEKTSNSNLWLANESLQSAQKLPSRFKIHDEDPYRVTVYSDIAPFMFVLKENASRNMLCWLCFKFFGYQIPYINLDDSFLDKFGINLKVDGIANMTDTGLFIEFFNRIVKRLLHIIDEDDVLVWCLEWDFETNGKQSITSAKEILKRKPGSVQLWCTYANIETKMGNYHKVDLIYTSGIKVLRTNNELMLFWSFFAEFSLFTDKNAVDVILRISKDVRSYENLDIAIKNCKTFLRQGMDECFEQLKVQLSEAFMKCLAILEYINSNITNALAIIDSFNYNLSSHYNSRIQESVYVFTIRLIKHYMSHSPYFKISIMRDYLEKAIRAFPHNLEFLDHYKEIERRYRIENNVNRIINDIVLDKDIVTAQLWQFAITYQMELKLVHVARSYFERAASHERTKSNVSFWLAYLSFENINGEKLDVKNIAFRGIVACPWSKDLIMQTLLLLGDNLTKFERRQLHVVLLERNLRIRIEYPDEEFEDEEFLSLEQLPLDADSEEETGDK